MTRRRRSMSRAIRLVAACVVLLVCADGECEAGIVPVTEYSLYNSGIVSLNTSFQTVGAVTVAGGGVASANFTTIVDNPDFVIGRYIVNGASTGIEFRLGSSVDATIDDSRLFQFAGAGDTIAVQLRTLTGSGAASRTRFDVLGFSNVDGQDSVTRTASVVAGPTSFSSVFTTIQTITAVASGTYRIDLSGIVDNPNGTTGQLLINGSPLANSRFRVANGVDATMDLSRDLQLSAGDQVSVQLMADSGSGQVQNASLDLLKFNAINGEGVASVFTDTQNSRSLSVGVTNVNSLVVGSGGLYVADFSTLVDNPGQLFGQFLVDGSSFGDEFSIGNGVDGSLDATRILNLGAGAHTVGVRLQTSGLGTTVTYSQLQLLRLNSVPESPSEPSPVPEPSSLVLLCFGCMTIGGTRWWQFGRRSLKLNVLQAH